MKRTILLVLFSILFTAFSKAQEVLFPLSSNQTIKEYLIKNNSNPSALRTTSSPDTLSLPFIDDFSLPFVIYPNASLWLDSGAFINSTFCDNPITVGVATLDGIDKYGNPYSTQGNSMICDYLTSKPIDLSGLTTADSVYFSFYYQPQGLGDEPESGDSLVLEFLTKDANWRNVWSHDGAPDTAFNRVNIYISDTSYLDSAFQFRFFNYATPNGNRDHWNIDYVMLDKKRTSLESLDGLKDIGFINKPTSLLKEYQSMPWSHYSNYASPSTLFKTSFADSIRNVWYSTAAITYHAKIDSLGGPNIYSFPPQTPISALNSATPVTSNLPGSFSFVQDISSASAEFIIKNYCDSIAQLRKDNDTTYYIQKFSNYYAYDDGSAEAAYGISVAYAKMAYRFDLKMADTLRGIQIYFNPWGLNVHNDLIQICLWDSINVAANYEHLVHKQINLYVSNIDSVNGFATYVFDTSQYVSGRIYVGIIQNNSDLLGIGVDVNTNSGSNMFINYNNQWSQSAIPASWMIRPFFGKDLRTGIPEQASEYDPFEIFPNPANNHIEIKSNKLRSGTTFEIYNVLGEIVYSRKPETKINVSGLPDGIYFVKAIDGTSKFSSVKGFIVQH